MNLARRILALFLCLAVFLIPAAAASILPQATGTHILWLDRFQKPSPDYATVFYRWLESNARADGALADPTRAEEIRTGTYGYLLRSFFGTASFRYDAGTDEAAAAREAAIAVVKARHADEVNEAYEYARAVYQAFDHDHPEVFWLSGYTVCAEFYGFSWRYANGYGTVEYTKRVYFYLRNDEAAFDVREPEYRNPALIAAGIAERDAAAASILGSSDVVNAATRYEQIRAINRALTYRNAYNTGSDLDAKVIGPEPRNCIGALDGRTGSSGPVCEGYARAFKLLCDRLGIPCVLVSGIVYPSGERHMWNCVQMDDGQWYGVDVTWNDPKSSKSSAARSGSETENYLLVGSDTFITSRTFGASHILRNDGLDTDFVFSNSPALSAVRYDPANAIPLAPSVGDVIGHVLHTDIVCFIDGHPIRSYNIGGNTWVVAEDLLSYGFKVSWYADTRRLAIGTTRTAAPDAYQPVSGSAVAGVPGAPAMPYYFTDIAVSLADRSIEGVNIGGFTCICMDDLASVFAVTYVWDPGARTLSMSTQH